MGRGAATSNFGGVSRGWTPTATKTAGKLENRQLAFAALVPGGDIPDANR